MKYRLLIILVLFALVVSCSDSPKDINGYPEEVLSTEKYNQVQSQYDSIGDFEYGSAIVKSHNLYGLIDSNGKLILPCDYEEITEIGDSVKIRFVKQNSKWGIIDHKAKTLINCHYDAISSFPDDKDHIGFQLNGKWGIVDIEDNVKVQFKYDELFTRKNFFVAQYRGAWGIESYDNNILLDYEYDRISWYTIDDEASFIKKGEKYGVVNTDGKLIAKCEYDNMPFERNGYIVLNKDDKYGLIDALNGNVVIPFEYEHLDDFSEDLIAAEKNQKYGFINIKNETVIPFQFDDAGCFSEGLALVGKITGSAHTYMGATPIVTYGFISKSGELVIPYKFKRMLASSRCEFSEGLCPYGVYKGPGGNIFANTYGYINTKGDIVIRAQFDDIEPFNNGFAAVKKDGKYGIINTKGEFVVPCEYGAIGYYEKSDTIIPLLDANYNQIAVYNIRKNLIRK